MKTRALICLVAWSLCFSASQPADGATNNWTKPSSGSWEEQAHWSAGLLPDATQSVVFTNPGWKALAIGAGTAQNFPQSMRVQSLSVGAPVDSHNTLLMNWSGFERPLQTTSLMVGSNSAVLVQGSALEVISTSTDGTTGNLLLGGTFIQSDYSQVKVHGWLDIGRFGGPGAYYLTNGTLSVNMSESMGGFGPGKLVQYGGSNNVSSLQVSIEGEYHLHGGQATATNGITVGFGDFADYASFYQYGGSVNADTVINGNYVLNGGSITGRMSVPGNTFQRVDGSVLQNGGTNFAVSMDLGHPNRFGGAAIYVLSNGVVRVDSSTTFRGGWFFQYNGLHTIASNFIMQGTWVGPGNVSAEYFLGGGTLSVGALTAQAAGFQQDGGSNLIAGALTLSAAPPSPFEPPPQAGRYTLGGGLLSARNVIVNATASGLAQFTQDGGHVEIGEMRLGERQFTATDARGEFLLTGGSFRCTNLNFVTGSFRQTGGTNKTQNIALPWLDWSFGEYFLPGGILISSNLSVGAVFGPSAQPGRGNFVQSGGIHTNSSMTLNGDIRHQFVTVYGSYSLSTGLLVCGTATIRGGNFSQSGGTNYTREILLDGAGSFALSGGELVSSDTTLDTFSCVESVFIQNNGNHRVQSRLKLDDFARYELRDGTLTATNIDIGPGAQFRQLGGSISNAGIFIIRGGAFRVGGLTQQLGQLQVLGVPVVNCTFSQATGPTLDVRFGGATTSTVLRFRDSRDVPWSGTHLSIVNWSASTNGAGPHHVFVGTNSQGLTASQVSQITFVNPVGWPAGNYPARILSTGEIFPAVLPVAFTRKPDGLILSWSGDYQLLSATNVTGPYVPIPGATIPFTNPFVGPQRFFRLESLAP